MMLEQIREALLKRGLTEAEVNAVLEEARVKTATQQLASQFVNSLTNIVGSDSLQEATIQVQVMNDAEGNIHVYWDFKLHSTTIGTIELSGKITPTPTQQTQQTHTQIQTQAQQTSKGEFEASIAVFKRLGYDIPQSYIGRMSWYFYNLANRVIRDRKHNDPEFVQWVNRWNAKHPDKQIVLP